MTKAIKPFVPSSADFTLTPDSGFGNALTSRTASGQGWPDGGTSATPTMNGSVYDESTHRFVISGKRILMPRGRYKMRLYADAYPETAACALGILVRAVGAGSGNKIFSDRRSVAAIGESVDPSIGAILDITYEDKGIEFHVARRTGSGVLRLQDFTVHLRYMGNEEEVG